MGMRVPIVDIVRTAQVTNTFPNLGLFGVIDGETWES